MKLTLQNFNKELPTALIRFAQKNKVRECDETEKGHFVAYVDENKETFDVSITISPASEIVLHACDCTNSDTFCRHKTALLMHVAEERKIKPAIKTKKKESKIETLLNEVDLDDLKMWVRGLFEKNPDIGLAFVHYFSAKNQQYTTVEVTKLVADAIKVVAGSKKNIDTTQLKRLVELWTDMLAPVVQNYYGNVADEGSFLNFHTLIENCMRFQLKIDSASNKVNKYIGSLLQKSAECINNLATEDAWNKSVKYFVDHVLEGLNKTRMHYLVHLKNIINVSDEERRKRLIDLLAKQYEHSYPDNIINGNQYAKVIFELVDENNLFPQYRNLFKPIRYDNEYNENLILCLIGINELDLAKKFCQEQIHINSREEYSIPYLAFLKEIYRMQNDEENLAKVLAILFPYTFEFDDYLFIAERLPAEERKKWRTKILSRSRNAAHNRNNNAMLFVFKLMDYEKNYKKMIDYIDSYTSYHIILKYFEPMFLSDKTQLMSTLVRKSDDYGWGAGYEKDAACFPELFELMKKCYSSAYLIAVINNASKDSWPFRINRFMAYVKEQLNNPKQPT